jgi:hypothetical protein
VYVLAFILEKKWAEHSDWRHVEIRRPLSLSTLISLGFPYTVMLTS